VAKVASDNTRYSFSEEQVLENSAHPPGVEDQQNTVDTTPLEKGCDIINEQQPRPIWGLNFLQDMKGELDEVTGAYDPDQQLWITPEQVQLDEKAFANVTGGLLLPRNLISDAKSLLGNARPKVGNRANATRTQGAYQGSTNTGGSRDKDSTYEPDTD
jgi:hypothetical protein